MSIQPIERHEKEIRWLREQTHMAWKKAILAMNKKENHTLILRNVLMDLAFIIDSRPDGIEAELNAKAEEHRV